MKRVLSKEESLLHARTRAKVMRRIFKEKFEGDVSTLPTRDEIEKQASEEADAEVFFDMKKKFLLTVIDFPDPVLREIHDFSGEQQKEKFIREISLEALNIEREVHEEAAQMLEKSVKDLATKFTEENIDVLREKLEEPIRQMVLQRDTVWSSEGVEIDPPESLRRLVEFNETLTRQIFEPAMALVLHNQWPDFGFTVTIFRYSSNIVLDISATQKLPPNSPTSSVGTSVLTPSPTRSDRYRTPVQADSNHSARYSETPENHGFIPCGRCCFCQYKRQRESSDVDISPPIKRQKLQTDSTKGD
jgi:hypothetical protein